jgi:hypothetical protein
LVRKGREDTDGEMGEEEERRRLDGNKIKN